MKPFIYFCLLAVVLLFEYAEAGTKPHEGMGSLRLRRQAQRGADEVPDQPPEEEDVPQRLNLRTRREAPPTADEVSHRFNSRIRRHQPGAKGQFQSRVKREGPWTPPMPDQLPFPSPPGMANIHA